MSRKTVASVVTLAIAAAVVDVPGMPQSPVNPTKAALTELDQKIKKWKGDQGRINKVFGGLGEVLQRDHKKLVDLNVKSDDDLQSDSLRDKAMAQRLETERRKANTRMATFVKKSKHLDEAIFDAEAKKKDISMKSTGRCWLPEELSKLMADEVDRQGVGQVGERGRPVSF